MAQDRSDDESGRSRPAATEARPESVGEYLATQRRLRGISLDELCERTKIPRRNLERLESGAFDQRPDGFARGFVRAIALDLGLDADEAVMRLVGEPSADELGGGSLAARAWLTRVGAAVSLVLVLLGISRLVMWLGSPSAEPPSFDESAVTYRHDVVGNLAADPTGIAPKSSDAATDAGAPSAKAEAAESTATPSGPTPAPASAP